MTIKNYLKDSNEQGVFRYLDYPKFLNLITSNEITFVKPCMFEDGDDCDIPEFTKIQEETAPFLKFLRTERVSKTVNNFIETIKNKPTKEEPENIFMYIFIQIYNAVMYNLGTINAENSNLIRDYTQKLTEAYVNKDYDKIRNILFNIDECESFVNRNIKEFYRNNTFVSCWHIADTESDAMWKVYSNKNGIAIKTNIGKLEQYLDFSVIEKEGYEAVMNRIIYEDKNKLFNNVNNKTGSELISTGKDDPSYFFFIKKHCYSYENELRVLFFKRPNSISSNKDNSLKLNYIHKLEEINPINKKNIFNIKIKADLTEFIDEIIVSPFVPDYYLTTLYCLFEKMNIPNLKNKIRKSNMVINEKYK